jgi:hypothetical protein
VPGSDCSRISLASSSFPYSRQLASVICARACEVEPGWAAGYPGFDQNPYRRDSELGLLRPVLSCAGHRLNSPPGAKSHTGGGRGAILRVQRFQISSAAERTMDRRFRSMALPPISGRETLGWRPRAVDENFSCTVSIFLDQTAAGRPAAEHGTPRPQWGAQGNSASRPEA